MYSVAPSQREGLYDSGIAVFKVKLSRLKIVLSNSVNRIKVEGNFLTTNAGMFLNTFGLKYTVDYTANGSLKINDSVALTCGVNDYVSSKTVNFEKDKDKKVLICVHKYLATGGDEYPFKFDKDEDLVAGGLDVDTPIYQMMGDYIKQLAESCGNILFYPAVSDDIQYNGFNFQKPDALNITVKDEKNIPQKGIKIICVFANDRGYHNFCATITNDAGVFKVTPAKGAHTLCVAALLNGASTNNTFLYGEVFTHSYLKMECSIECQVSQMDSSKYCLFSKNHLSQFKHSFIGTATSHHSNYLDYIDENGGQCALTIVDNKINSRKGSGNSFEQVSSVRYKNIEGGISTLTLPLQNGRIEYIPWVGQNAKVRADLIQNPEVSDLCGGGDARISSTYCDGTLFAKNRQNRVTGLHIQHGEILDGIGFIYADNNEYFFGNPTGGRGDVFRFAEGEYITKITGGVRTTYYNCVTNLKIITNKKEYGPFGWSAEKEKPFEISKANHKICALLGEGVEPKNWDKKVVRKIGAMFMPVQQLK